MAVLLLANSAHAAANYKGQPGPFPVETLKLEWQDAKRDREVPAKIYFPKSGTTPCPVIVFSHGLGAPRGARWGVDTEVDLGGSVVVVGSRGGVHAAL